MKRARLLLSFDIEEFDLPEEFGAAIPEEAKFGISGEGTAAVLKLLREKRVRATFFITGVFAERFPELVGEMVRDGHEIASHGMNHTTFTPADLRGSKELLERLSGKAVTGFRMARLAPVTKEEILKAGFLYESSLNPVWLPGRYNNLGKPLLPFREPCGLRQFPISAVPGCRFPLFWLSFKNLPLSCYGMLARSAVAMTGYYNMYTHPWEYSSRCAEPEWQIPGYIVRRAGASQLARLSALIDRLQSKGDFMTFQEYPDPISGE